MGKRGKASLEVVNTFNKPLKMSLIKVQVLRGKHISKSFNKIQGPESYSQIRKVRFSSVLILYNFRKCYELRMPNSNMATNNKCNKCSISGSVQRTTFSQILFLNPHLRTFFHCFYRERNRSGERERETLTGCLL